MEEAPSQFSPGNILEFEETQQHELALHYNTLLQSLLISKSWKSHVHLSLSFCFLNLVLNLFISKLQTAQNMDADTTPIQILSINFKSQMIWNIHSLSSSSSCEWKCLLPGFTFLHSRTCRYHLHFKMSTLKHLMQLSESVISLICIKIEFSFIHTSSKTWKVIKNCKGTFRCLFWPTEKEGEMTFRNYT